jgi:hypothetical protein
MRHLKNIILVFVGIMQMPIFAQNLPTIEKRKFISPDGKLYVQKSLPIYLMLNTSPDDKMGSFVLKSENTAAYSNPLYFDAEGLNTIRTPWCVDPASKELKLPKQDIVFEVYADSKPPITHIDYGKNKFYNKDGKLYTNSQVVITMVANDALSGVDKTMYSFNNEEYKSYTAPITLDSENEYIMKYFSYDNVGNVEALRTITIVIDKSSPKTSLEIKGDYSENIISGNAKLVLKNEETSSGLAKLMVVLDENKEIPYSGAIIASKLNQGQHTLTYYSADNVENTEEQHVYEFYVDKTPPTILQEIIGKSYMINGKEFSSGRSQLKLTTMDNKAGVKEVYYSINNSEYKLYEKPVLLSAVSGGILIKAYALDNVNNRSQVADEEKASSLPFIDLAGPEMGYNLQGPVLVSTDTIYINSKTKIHLKARDNDAGVNQIQYTIDNKELITYNSPVSIDQEGLHTISYTGTDNVDNTNTNSLTVFVDNTGPELYPRFSAKSKGNINDNGKTLTIYPSHVGLFVSATDIQAGYDKMVYSLNGSKEKPFTGYVGNFAKNPEITVKAYDKLGNESEIKLEFALKN